MNRNLKLAYFIALLTLAGILTFQCFWIYITYKRAKQNFLEIASNALQKSVNESELRQTVNLSKNWSVPELENGQPEVSMRFNLIGKTDDRTKAILKDSANKWNEQKKLEFANNYARAIREGMAKAINKTFSNPPDLALIQRLFRKELVKNHIYLPSELTFVPGTDLNDDQIYAVSGLNKGETAVRAEFSYPPLFFIRQVTVPVVISVLLILLTIICLMYLRWIINKQQQLSDLKNNFINNMTHELRTPIAVLKSTHESLNQFGNIYDIETAKRYLAINQAILDKIDNDVDRILDIMYYERKEKLLVIEDIDLHVFVEEVISRFSPENQKLILLQYNLNEQVIRSDKYCIDTIITNLIDNAIKYNEVPSEVTLTIENYHTGWQLHIADDGPGMEETQVGLIFDKFYRITKGNIHNVKGYGLGLSYVKELVKMMKGTILVKTQIGAGSVFTVQFPNK